MNLDSDVISCYKVDYQPLFSYINWNHFRAGRELDSYMPLQFSSVAQLCPTLCDSMDYTVYGILQARILEWVTFPFSRGFSQPRDQIQISCIAGGFFTS